MEDELTSTVVTVMTMGLYGGTYLADVLRRHDNRAPLRFMMGQFIAMWVVQAFLHSYFGHEPSNAIWLGALFSTGSTVIGKASCWAYTQQETKKGSSD